ncbi:MAG: hypothetical protein DRN53_00025 [Thermoprotei archaeon]|nr:MAG: hypothetical protein DRN53_00025 [Thermoprotei archaeon]
MDIKSVGIVKETLEFLEQVNHLLDNMDFLRQSIDINDLWILVNDLENDASYIIEDIGNLVDIPPDSKEEIPYILEKVISIVKDMRSLLDNYSKPDDLLSDLIKNKNIIEYITDSLLNLEDHIADVLNKIKNTIYYLRRSARDAVLFKGREGIERSKELEDIKSKLFSYTEKLIKYQHSCNSLFDQIMSIAKFRTIIGDISKFQRSALHVARQLAAKVQGRIWAMDILNILTGLQSITASPISEFVEFDIEDEEPIVLSVDELFYRYPPFEPIAIKKNVLLRFRQQVTIPVEIAGAYVWFIDTPNLNLESKKRLTSLKTYSKEYPLVNGRSIEKGHSIELKILEPVNVVNEKDIILRINSENGNRVWIKYGSHKLRSTAFKCGKKLDVANIKECIQKLYTESVRKSRGEAVKTYSATNLSYAWFCILGYGLSTDPWDYMECPFRKNCIIGRSIKRKRCPYWSYSRRIFPKVFPLIERKIYGLSPSSESIGPLTLISESGVSLVEEYTGVQWNMPSVVLSGPPVSLKFIRPIIRSLPETNVVGFAIPLELIYSLADNLLDKEFQPKPRFTLGRNKETNLTWILVSKFYLWRKGSKGLRLYNILRTKQKLLDNYKEFVDKISAKNKVLMKEFRSFIAEVIGHSLAHLLLSYLAEKLELEPRDLIYHAFIDKRSKLLYVLVAENSPFGNLNLPEYVDRTFGSMKDMVKSFIQDVLNAAKKHEEDLERYNYLRNDAFKKFISTNIGVQVKPLIDRINNYYDKLVEEKLILDISSFTLHLVISRLYEDFAQKERVDLNIARRELNNILSYIGPNICIDGCSGCIIFDRGCHDTLAQPITLSRRLATFFLEIFYRGSSVIAKGNLLGPSLLESIPRRKLVAITPFIDREGVKLLNTIAKEGVKVKLITREASLKKYASIMRGIKAGYTTRPRHEKIYIIDDEVIIYTSWNLMCSSSSTNTFRIEIDPKKAKQLEEEVSSEVIWYLE